MSEFPEAPDPDFKALFEGSPGLFLVLLPDDKFTIIAASDAYISATMTKRSHILGRGIFEVFPDNPSDPEASGVINLKASLNRVVKNKVPDAMAVQKYDIRKPDFRGGGFEERYWSPINSPVLDKDGNLKYVIHEVEDITEFVHLKNRGATTDESTEYLRTESEKMASEIFFRGRELQEANKKLRENEELLRTLIDGIKDYAIIRLDPNGNIVSWNEGAKRIIGYDTDEIVGQHFSKFYPEEDVRWGKLKWELDTAKQQGRVEDESWRVRKDGSRFWANMILSALRDSDGKLIGFTKVTRDVTERKEAENQRRQLVEKLRELDRLKTQFFSNVSHELRTPLSLIIGPTDRLLREEKLSEKGVQNLEVILRNASILLRHVNDLLDIARLEEGRLTPNFVNGDLVKIAKGIAINFQSKAAERGIKFSVSAPNSLAAQFDPNMIQRVLLNLIGNAFKFTPDGGEIEIRLKSENGNAVLEVEDNGPGVPKEARNTIFERFRQLETKSVQRQSGTGLGLSIAKEFVELHEGEIKVDEGEKKGALFSVRFPLKASSGQVVDKDMAAQNNIIEIIPYLDKGQTVKIRDKSHYPKEREHRERILVVEDNPDLNRFLCELLDPHYTVDTAFDGEEGLQKAIELKPDLILSDIMMPKMTGDEMLKEIRKRPELESTLAILLTAKADDMMRLQSLYEGVQDYIVKPFVAEEVIARIENLFTVRRVQELTNINTLIENALDCVIGMNEKGYITHWNLQAEKTLGWTKSEAIGHRMSDTIIPPTYRASHEIGLRRFLKTGEGPIFGRRLEFTSLRRDGSEIPIELSVTPIRSNNAFVFYGFVRDISERVKMLEELRQAKDQAEIANYAKSAFLANMSHEIRTPLSAILGFSDLIADSNIKARERANFIRSIKRNGELLSNIINDILDLSKVEAGKLDVEYNETALFDLMEDIASSLNVQASENNTRLSISYSKEVPRTIRTDPLRLQQILLNIVGNAIKFTEKGRVDIKVDLISPEKNRSILAFVVKDTGVGISEEAAERLFRPFSQEDYSATRQFGGVGLGLSLSKRLARLLGGDVVLTESKKGKGSTFTITIDPGPVAAYKGRVSPQKTISPSRKIPPIRLDGIKVLLAEDSYDNQIIIRKFLKEVGANVDTAENGKIALEKAKTGQYDVILMDIQMPIMDGYSAVAEIRKKGINTPIIALTAHALREERQKTLASGFNEHISKPVERAKLIERVKQFGKLKAS